MEHLDVGEKDAGISAPSPEEAKDGATPPETPEEEKDLTDDELREQIDKLREEAKEEKDSTEKRHKEQEAGWKQKILKEREKAKALEEGNRKTEETRKAMEDMLLQEAYSKTVNDDFGLPYFESLSKTNPELADRLAKEKFDRKNARDLILSEKRKRAAAGDEESAKLVSEEEIRAAERERVYHELALEQVDSSFEGLTEPEREEAKAHFEDIAEGKKLTPATAKKYAEMAKTYATRNRKPGDDPKPKKDAGDAAAAKAATGISPKS